MAYKKLIGMAVLSGMMAGAIAQEEEDCGKTDNKKILKLLEQSRDSKYQYRERYQFVKDALAIDENCAPCLLRIGKMAFDKSQSEGTTTQYAEDYFKRLIEACPKYNALPYYAMGIIYYGREDYENAIPYFKQFVEFKITDDGQQAPDHDQKKMDVKNILPELEFYSQYYKNTVPFNPQPVENVCTEWGEILPMISPDNEILFFTREINKKALGDITSRWVQEFTMSYRKDMNSPFDAGKALPPPFNVGDYYGGATISVDNKEMIICACKKNNEKFKDYNNCDLYVSKYEKFMNMNSGKYEYKWSDIEPIGGNINTKDGWEAQPSLSADGKTLYFAKIHNQVNLPSDQQKSDIYYSTRDASGNWTSPKLVPTINTKEGDEKAPFMHSDSKTLYFAAEVGADYWGAGGLDIFYTKQKEDGSWTEPKNIGYPINSEHNEPGLFVSTDGHWAYFTSNKLTGARGYDIFRFELPYEARPEKVVLVKGSVTDESGAPVENATVQVKYNGSEVVEEIKVDPEDGKYAVVLNVEKGQDAVITVKKPDHTVDTKIIAANTTEPVIKNVDLKTEEVQVGKPYTINDILFATDSYELTDKSKFVIDQFVLFLKENESYSVSINGHTDDVGDNAKNKLLSENRANAVKEYIVSKGIAASRMKSEGFGEEKPKVPNSNDYNRSLNRRTEFVITGK